MVHHSLSVFSWNIACPSDLQFEGFFHFRKSFQYSIPFLLHFSSLEAPIIPMFYCLCSLPLSTYPTAINCLFSLHYFMKSFFCHYFSFIPLLSQYFYLYHGAIMVLSLFSKLCHLPFNLVFYKFVLISCLISCKLST